MQKGLFTDTHTNLHMEMHMCTVCTHTQTHKQSVPPSALIIFTKCVSVSVCMLCVSACVCVEREKGDMQIYVNLIILLVPCVFSLELTASRDQRERLSERERDLIWGIELQMNRK